MRKLISFMHISLDGFVSGENGEMEWILVDNELFDFVAKMTDQADSALYGRVTYEMMQNYWPTAGEQANATKHDIEHSEWYNKVSKIVLSRTIKTTEFSNVKFINDNLSENINEIKKQEGRNILIFGSPRATQSLLNEELIDEFWLFVNPIILNEGMPMFKDIKKITNLKFIENRNFSNGVIALHYGIVNN
ncbi:dihydrofolate reductase family protein [Clostridium saccharoperbutylacetonicum]